MLGFEKRCLLLHPVNNIVALLQDAWVVEINTKGYGVNLGNGQQRGV